MTFGFHSYGAHVISIVLNFLTEITVHMKILKIIKITVIIRSRLVYIEIKCG